MSSTMKVFLLLAAIVCISKAQLHESGQQCLCQRVRGGIASKTEVKDIQIYPATIFCDKVEIVVTVNSGLRYCLNPKKSAVKRLLDNILRKQKASTATPSAFISTPGSTNTASM